MIRANFSHGLVALVLLLSGICAHAAVETWTNLDGQSMQAEFVSLTGSQVTFRKPGESQTYSYPLDRLSTDDQQRIRDQITQQTQAVAQTAPAPDGKYADSVMSKALKGKLVTANRSRITKAPSDTLDNVGYYAIYYSASWCPPCRAFTPDLVKTYNRLKSRHPDFELIFVSSDRNEDDFDSYIRDYKMPWPSVAFESARSINQTNKYKESGIPNLVFVKADGEVIAQSYVNGEYIGPRKVLDTIVSTLNKRD